MILVPFMFMGIRMAFAWYTWHAANLPASGTIFGITYHSELGRQILLNIQFFWFLLLLNIVITFAFHLGLRTYKEITIIMMFDIAAMALATVIFGLWIAGDTYDIVMGTGIFLVVVGTAFIVAHKQISTLLSTWI